MKTWGYIVIAALAVLVVIAGVGGYMLGDRAGQARANAVRRQFFAQRQGNQGQGFGQGLVVGTPGARPATSGTVKSVDGNTIVVTTRNNGDVKVQVADNAIISKMETGTIKDIQPGLRIIVVGERGASGVITAQSVQLLPNETP